MGKRRPSSETALQVQASLAALRCEVQAWTHHSCVRVRDASHGSGSGFHGHGRCPLLNSFRSGDDARLETLYRRDAGSLNRRPALLDRAQCRESKQAIRLGERPGERQEDRRFQLAGSAAGVHPPRMPLGSQVAGSAARVHPPRMPLGLGCRPVAGQQLGGSRRGGGGSGSRLAVGR
jgi:hypothetical protein